MNPRWVFFFKLCGLAIVVIAFDPAFPARAGVCGNGRARIAILMVVAAAAGAGGLADLGIGKEEKVKILANEQLPVVIGRKLGLIDGMKAKAIVVVDPEIMSGTPCFAGTRVPVRNLLDYLEAGDPLDEFLEQFPTVSRAQAVAFLEQSAKAMLGKIPQAA